MKSLCLGNLPMPNIFSYINWYSVQAKAWLISNNTMVYINQLHVLPPLCLSIYARSTDMMWPCILVSNIVITKPTNKMSIFICCCFALPRCQAHLYERGFIIIRENTTCVVITPWVHAWFYARPLTCQRFVRTMFVKTMIGETNDCICYNNFNLLCA